MLHEAATLAGHAEGGRLVPTAATVARHADDLLACAHGPAEGTATPVVVLVGVNNAHILVVTLAVLVGALLAVALTVLVALLLATPLGGLSPLLRLFLLVLVGTFHTLVCCPPWHASRASHVLHTCD